MTQECKHLHFVDVLCKPMTIRFGNEKHNSLTFTIGQKMLKHNFSYRKHQKSFITPVWARRQGNNLLFPGQDGEVAPWWTID